jgi:hypothetical protein
LRKRDYELDAGLLSTSDSVFDSGSTFFETHDFSYVGSAVILNQAQNENGVGPDHGYADKISFIMPVEIIGIDSAVVHVFVVNGQRGGSS